MSRITIKNAYHEAMVKIFISIGLIAFALSIAYSLGAPVVPLALPVVVEPDPDGIIR